ncbi:hypothetical protein GF312_16575 [Candidatus Poribacteria bacterium]|nr:hypothetical protein [Candidatus Poribacteria bacterium]
MADVICKGFSIEHQITSIWPRISVIKLLGLSIEPVISVNFIKVYDKNGNPISGAKVKIIDNQGKTIVNTTTELSGEAYGNFDENIATPFILTVYKPGYEFYKMRSSVADKGKLQISLRRSAFSGRDAMGDSWI